MEDTPPRRGISKEAWVAIGAIGAALVTGVVTLLTYVIAPDRNPPASAPGTSLTASSPTPSAVASTIDAIAGKWEGMAQDSNHVTFRIMLEINSTCAIGQLCGSIGVTHVPCYGHVFLDNVDGDEVEFRVADFDARSNRTACQPGAGERFRLRPDGMLAYRTTYEPIAQGTLKRV
jgi:hypothetical protein